MNRPRLYLLAIDDDPFFLEVLDRAIANRRTSWELEGHVADRRWLEGWADQVGDRISDYDLLCIDYTLDGACAEDLVPALRAYYPHCPPIAILSGTLDADRRRRCLEQGAACCLSKPRNADAVEEVLDSLERLAETASHGWFPPRRR